VSSVHVAGHFQEFEGLSSQNATHSLHGINGIGLDFRTFAADPHAGHSHTDDAKEVTHDCSIYHILLSLNGGFWAPQAEHYLPHVQAGRPSTTLIALAQVLWGSQSIRAPPQFS